jgi:Tfp pilus assembly protein PilF
MKTSLRVIAIILLLGFTITLLAGATPQKSEPAKAVSAADRSEAVRLNNLGTAYVNQQVFEKAANYFHQAVQADPNLVFARLNEGIALANSQKTEEAKAAFEEVVKREPENPRGWYNLGLLDKSIGDGKAAIEAFQKASQLAPNDADAAYFLGMAMLQDGQNEAAVLVFQRALKLNPFHASAEFGLARAYRNLGQMDQAKVHQISFDHIRKAKLGSPITLAYGDQGPLSLVVTVNGAEGEAAAPIPVKFVDASSAIAVSRPPALSKQLGSGACFFDYDKDGKPDLLLTQGESGGVMLFHNIGNGKFEDVTKASGIDAAPGAVSCAASDYDNDEFTDIAIGYTDHVALWHNEHNGTFKNVTEAAGLKLPLKNVASLTWIDYDHDNDTDLYVSSADGASVLLRNNGNGTFTDVTAETGMSGDGAQFSAVGSDFNNDRAVDFVVAGKNARVLLNPREGKFQPIEGAPAIKDAAGVAVLDFNKDGWMDLAFTHSAAPGLTLWRNVEGKKLEQVALPDLHWTQAWGIAPIDYDNDGYIDLVAVGENASGKLEVKLLRNEGTKGFRDVTAEVGLDKLSLADPSAVVVADYDGDGAADLLITQKNGSPVLLRNEGGTANNSLRLALKGLNDNKSGIGTKVEVFAGGQSQKFELTGAGYLGQSNVDIIAGLGKAKQADAVRMLWPSGVIQDEIEVASNKPASILELDRRGSSCPVLFAWNGNRYQFITDMIGAGVVGHWIGPNQRDVPDPTEYVKVDGSIAKVRNGKLSFRFMEPMEEVVYVDQLRLIAVDHPANYAVNSNEAFISNPPYPDFKLVSSRAGDLRPVAAAFDNEGRDVASQLAKVDHQFVNDLHVLQFAGFTDPHTLTLNLGEPYKGGTLRLLLNGYVEYFSATSLYAAHQAGLDPVSPYIEAQDASGKWVRVVDDMGFPAGLPRTMVADLSGKLPIGTTRVRIGTNLQIYWDQILVDRTAGTAPIRKSEVPLATARMGFHGYPRDVIGKNPGDHWYVYEDVSATGPFVHQAGQYTRPGDVTQLIKNVDDRFVVFGTGDEVQVDFDPSHLPKLQDGWVRDYFFFADGYEKDMDFYAADGLTVEPLPFRAMGSYPYAEEKGYPYDAEHLKYLLDYNTRFYAGDERNDYQFHYKSAISSAGGSQ